MKRPLLAVVLGLLGLALVSQAFAAPIMQDARPVIAQPEPDATVRGLVQVVGTATHPQFQRYELYYAPWPVPSDNAWIFVGPDAHFQQQPLGLLGTWDSRAVPDGQYGLRIRVVKADGNYMDSEPRRVVVANTKPAETPTPTASPTPSESPTPAGPEPTMPPPTAAAVATVPPSSRATVQAAPTAAGDATPGPTPILGGGSGSSGGDEESIISTAGKALNPSRLAGTARTAGLYTVGLFVALGFFFGIKALLYWLWQKMRP